MGKHVFLTNRESRPESYGDALPGGYADEANIWMMDSGIHNGPMCKLCGKCECMHCHDEFLTEECPANKSEV